MAANEELNEALRRAVEAETPAVLDAVLARADEPGREKAALPQTGTPQLGRGPGGRRGGGVGRGGGAGAAAFARPAAGGRRPPCRGSRAEPLKPPALS